MNSSNQEEDKSSELADEKEKPEKEEAQRPGEVKKKKFKGIPKESPLKSKWERYLKIWEWSWYDIALLFLIIALIINVVILLAVLL